MSDDHKVTARIRMYRQGLGDCFLLTFTQAGREDFNMMIDCGLLQGTANGKEIMLSVAEDIEATLRVERAVAGETKKWLDVVVLTHEHADHISGFTQARQVFDRIHFGEVWTSWVDDERHSKYKHVREHFHKQLKGLTAAVNRMKSEEQRGLKETVTALLYDFFEDGFLAAKQSTSGRSPSLEYALKKSVSEPKGWVPGDVFTLGGFDDVRVYILGPPAEYETFRKVNPPKDQTYRCERSNFSLADSFFAAAGGGDLFDTELFQPFESDLRIDVSDASKNEFFLEHYGFGSGEANEWRRINDDWLMVAGGLALNLDNFTNNTSLAFAIELVGSGKVLLFPGDAQYANWISWQELTWKVAGAGEAKRKLTVKDLLKRTVFYKVGHHGSHNGTLKTCGLEMMSDSELTAMMSVDRKKAKSQISKTNPRGWEMPEDKLFERLKEKTRGRLVLADEVDDTALKDICQDPEFLENVKFLGSFVRDNRVSTAAEPLYIELTVQG